VTYYLVEKLIQPKEKNTGGHEPPLHQGVSEGRL
jgi:hypothetical protein